MVWLDHLFGGRFPIGVSLAIISTVIVSSILLSLIFPKDAPRRRSGAVLRIARPAVGVLFLLLAVIGFLYAAGPGHDLVPLPALNALSTDTLVWAAACNLVCGLLLLTNAASAASR
jgi:energy-converting hydrogenase Eha subunit A